MKIDLSSYEKGFKPKFDEKKYQELLKDTPTRFKIDGKEITFRKELIKTFLVNCKHLSQSMDFNGICGGVESSGKSHLATQLSYVQHKLMTALGMIKYPFTLDVIYYNVEEIIKAFDEYAHIPYMIFVLDESDSLSRTKWNSPIVKTFLSKLRRERKNLRWVILCLPQLSELVPSITLTRINLIFEVRLKTKDDKIVRGNYNLFTIPRGQNSFSLYKDEWIDVNLIKNTIARKLYSTDERYFNLPKNIMSFQGTFNSISPIDEKEYLKRSLQANKELETDDTTVMTKRDKLIQSKEKYKTITNLRATGMQWKPISKIYECNDNTLRKWYNSQDIGEMG